MATLRQDLTDDCPICFDSLLIYDATEGLGKTPCGHLYHKKCISEWLTSGVPGNCCPLCQQSLTIHETITMFVNDGDRTEENSSVSVGVSRSIPRTPHVPDPLEATREGIARLRESLARVSRQLHSGSSGFRANVRPNQNLPSNSRLIRRTRSTTRSHRPVYSNTSPLQRIRQNLDNFRRRLDSYRSR